MKAWKILVHSFRQVFGNMSGALRVSGLIYLITLGLVGLTVWQFYPRLIMMMRPENRGELVLFISIIVLIFLIGTIWIGVAWHRYVLLIERPGLLPQMRADRVLAYLGTSLLIALLVIIGIGLPAILMLNVVGRLGSFVAIILGIVILLTVSVVSFRLSTSLPGTALGSGRGFGDAWQATKGETPTLLALALMMGVFSTILNKIGEAFISAGLWPYLTVLAVTTWISMMVGFSLLTTLYGHYIEKRPLV